MERLLDVNQVSELLGVKPSTLYYWVHTGYIPHHHIGKLLRFKESEIEEWFDETAEHSEGRVTRHHPCLLTERKDFHKLE